MALAHHTLIAWQRADDLFIRLHQLSLKAFPAFERFELGTQLRRAAFSAAVNVVEGFATEHLRKRLNFLGAPLAGLIRSEQLKLRTGNATVVILIVLLGTRLF